MGRLGAAIGLCIVFLFVVYLTAGLLEFPAAVVCDRGAKNVEVSSTAPFGYFEEQRI